MMLFKLRLFRSNTQIRFILRLCHEVKIQNSEKHISKDAPDVINYLNSSREYIDIKDKLPSSLLRKYKTPESMYLINKKTAADIVNAITKYFGEAPVVEVNPGLGLLSKELLENQVNHIYMYETSHHFTQNLNQLKAKYPGRVTFKEADFFGMWKLAFRDKMDNGNRINDLLGDLATNNNRKVNIVGSMPGLAFVKHLINNIIFHNNTNQLGSPSLFITMPIHHYEFLTDDMQMTAHRSLSALFQLMFDYKVLRHVPKVHFLPWTHNPQNPQSKKVKMMDEYNLVLVNITQKDKLPCPPDYLPLLWYFLKRQVFSKTTRVIPLLEQWIPGCGVWLITGQDPPDTNQELSPGDENASLPHMTIFTQFGDLTLQQKITVFKKFISWPEFEQCQFRTTMENNLPKYVTAIDDDDDEKDSIRNHIDIDNSDTDIENE